jgi:hypothetical protein
MANSMKIEGAKHRVYRSFGTRIAGLPKTNRHLAVRKRPGRRLFLSQAFAGVRWWANVRGLLWFIAASVLAEFEKGSEPDIYPGHSDHKPTRSFLRIAPPLVAFAAGGGGF